MEPRSLYEAFHRVATARADRIAFRCKRGDRWHDVTWSDQREVVDRVSKSLLALGIEKGDRVAIVSQTCLEWMQADSGIVCTGAVTVGIYDSLLAPDCGYILGHCGARVAIVENAAQLQKVLSVRDELPDLRHIVVMDGASDENAGVLTWREFLEHGQGVADSRIEEIGAALEFGDLASVVYTSGTTGLPKGAMITHGNLLATVDAARQVLFTRPEFETLLFLPLAHIYARMIAYLCQNQGQVIAFAEDIGQVPRNIKEIRPHFIISVPRVLEKIREKVTATANQASGLRRKLFHWSLDAGRETALRRLEGRSVPLGLAIKHAVADRLVLHKVRDVLGGRVAWIASGSAPLSRHVNEFFHACGIPVIEGIGQTENTSLSNVNRLDHNKIGTVGPVVPGMEMKLASDGEILFRGASVMQGYFNDPDATAETIDADGWLLSGDIGEIDEDGFLRITDRKKDLIVTAGGKNVAPQRIERKLRASPYIGHAVAYGDRRKYITALVTLDPEAIRNWAAENGLTPADPEELASNDRVRGLIEAEIAECNRGLASFETVKQFRILPGELTIEAGDLTPTMKLKRKVVHEKHSDLLEQMYIA